MTSAVAVCDKLWPWSGHQQQGGQWGPSKACHFHTVVLPWRVIVRQRTPRVSRPWPQMEGIKAHCEAGGWEVTPAIGESYSVSLATLRTKDLCRAKQRVV